MIWGLPVLQPQTTPPKPPGGLQQGFSWNLSTLLAPSHSLHANVTLQEQQSLFPSRKTPRMCQTGTGASQASQLSEIPQEREQGSPGS